MKHSRNLLKLIDALRALPGVGPKTAQRMAFHLLQEGRPGAHALAQALGSEFDRETRDAWQAAMGSICRAMESAAAPPAR